MKAMKRSELSACLCELYPFLDTFAHKWLRTYFADNEEFLDFLNDEDIHVLAYRDDHEALVCVVILDENSILTTAFSNCAEEERVFAVVLGDVEALAKELRYSSIYYGAGRRSFGFFYNATHQNAFGDYLKQNGFRVESVSYDIRHETSSMKQDCQAESCQVMELADDMFRNNAESEGSDAKTEAIRNNLIRYPADTCYVAVKSGALLGFVLLDPVSCTIDVVRIFESSLAIHREIKKKLLSVVAGKLRSAGTEFLIETNVDQLECQRISHPFEVCGRYESMVKNRI